MVTRWVTGLLTRLLRPPDPPSTIAQVAQHGAWTQQISYSNFIFPQLTLFSCVVLVAISLAGLAGCRREIMRLFQETGAGRLGSLHLKPLTLRRCQTLNLKT